MIVGMTGFGRAQFKDRHIELNLQMRSVNCRFFETAFHMPQSLVYLEGKIKKYLHKRIKRGRISFNLALSGSLAGKVSVDNELARQYAKRLARLRRELSLSGETTLAQLSAFPGVISLKENSLADKIIWSKIERLLKAACGDLLTMRIKEGRAITKDILARLNTINKKLLFVKRRASLFVANKRRQLKDIIGNAEEISAIIKSCDISEEVMRLGFHCKSFAKKISSSRRHVPLGKELDFIAQEMQREANTMGAKSQDAHIASAVIEIKSQIEKIREQLQNAE